MSKAMASDSLRTVYQCWLFKWLPILNCTPLQGVFLPTSLICKELWKESVMVEPSLMVFFFIITEKNKSRVSFCPLSLMAMERGFKSYQDLLEMSKSYSFVYHQPSCKGEHARYNVYVYLITPTCTQLTINLQGKGV